MRRSSGGEGAMSSPHSTSSSLWGATRPVWVLRLLWAISIKIMRWYKLKANDHSLYVWIRAIVARYRKNALVLGRRNLEVRGRADIGVAASPKFWELWNFGFIECYLRKQSSANYIFSDTPTGWLSSRLNTNKRECHVLATSISVTSFSTFLIWASWAEHVSSLYFIFERWCTKFVSYFILFLAHQSIRHRNNIVFGHLVNKTKSCFQYKSPGIVGSVHIYFCGTISM